MFIILLLVAGALVFTIWLTNWVLSKAEGPQAMRDVAAAIREGAEGFLATQYSAILMYALTSCVRFCSTSRGRRRRRHLDVGMAACTAATFITGALMSAAAGYAVRDSVRANVRTAAAALRSYEEAINVALRGGAVCGLLVVGSCVFGLTSLFMTLRFVFRNLPAWFIPNLLVGFGFGASLVALFAQLGGGIYTRRRRRRRPRRQGGGGIPEDDPRNPAASPTCATTWATAPRAPTSSVDLGGDHRRDAPRRLLGEDARPRRRHRVELHALPAADPLFDLIVGVLSVHVKKSGNVILSDGSAKKNEGSSFDVEGGEKSSLLDNYKDLGGNSASALEDPPTSSAGARDALPPAPPPPAPPRPLPTHPPARPPSSRLTLPHTARAATASPSSSRRSA